MSDTKFMSEFMSDTQLSLEERGKLAIQEIDLILKKYRVSLAPALTPFKVGDNQIMSGITINIIDVEVKKLEKETK